MAVVVRVVVRWSGGAECMNGVVSWDDGDLACPLSVPARACSSNCMRPTFTNSPVPSSALLSGRVMVVAGCLFSMTVGSTGGAGVLPSASSRAALRGDGSNSSTSPIVVVPRGEVYHFFKYIQDGHTVKT